MQARGHLEWLSLLVAFVANKGRCSFERLLLVALVAKQNKTKQRKGVVVARGCLERLSLLVAFVANKAEIGSCSCKRLLRAVVANKQIKGIVVARGHCCLLLLLQTKQRRKQGSCC